MSCTIATENGEATKKTETKSFNETYKEVNEEELKRGIQEIFYDEGMEGVLDPSENLEKESEREESPKVINEIKKKKEIPKKTEEKNVIPKNANSKKVKQEETSEEQEKRLLQELLLEMNEGEVVGILNPSADNSRSSSKVSGKK